MQENLHLEMALATPGFMDEKELAYLATLAGKCKHILEIGTWRGRSARAFADNLMDGGSLTCVDTFADNAYGAVFPGDASDLCQHPDWLWKEFHKNLGDHIGRTVFAARMSSMDGARCFSDKRYNCVFVDAGHWYEDVRQDILCWRPLLAEGGILCGHDYNPIHHPPVIQAVDEFVPKFRVVPKTTIWTTEGI